MRWVVAITLVIIVLFLILHKTNIAVEELDTFLVEDFIPPAKERLEFSPFNATLGKAKRIVYNRVPKCGSSAVESVLRHLAVLNGFTYYRSKLFRDPVISEADQLALAKKLASIPAPFIYDRHIHFVDLGKYWNVPPVYLNLVRDPIEQRVSAFYYRRTMLYNQNKPKGWLNMTFDECVAKGGLECTGPYAVSLGYICGQEPHCRYIGSDALKDAKRHIENDYAIVGITEDLEAFLFVLEKTIPHFFKGALDIYEPLKAGLLSKYRTKNRGTISEESREILSDILRDELEFYEFARQRFYKLLSGLQEYRMDGDLLLEASDKSAAYLAANVNASGFLVAPGAEEDLFFYYKLPMALFIAGKLREANRVLDHIKLTFMRRNGDFRTSKEVKTKSVSLNEYYPYSNGWIIMAAQRMERYDVVHPGMRYLLPYYSSGTFPTNGPPKERRRSTDIFTAAHFGMIALTMGDTRTALRAARIVLRVITRQPDLDHGFYLRLDRNKHITTEYDPNAANFHLIERRAPFQLYFMIGYPAVFLARLHLATGNDFYLYSSKFILDWAMTCDASMYTFHLSHKLALASSIVAKVTGEVKYKELSERISTFLMSVQNEDGTFLDPASNIPADVLEQTPEISVWLRIIDSMFY
ncbi:hypothetical protein CAPTEDRAFT_215347 [Capitella teleta]|uniref:Sulfotransferase domain-containing protein n=1 Tax=Capitella teleta TaxID=283909 RepID=R7UZ37_CAPTE|nr:hypothetical protein CAPTEDRAFT_215347 [Capitella teleta]|eukprot:ELU11537.1 hypothetical protein CAPTEDRAFT_215347 [Capitella teleta]